MSNPVNETQPITFPSRLLAARHIAGLSKANAAKLLGVSELTVDNWEKGKTKPAGGAKQEQAVLKALSSHFESQPVASPPSTVLEPSNAAPPTLVSDVQAQLDQMRAMIEGLVKAQTQPKPEPEAKPVAILAPPPCPVPAQKRSTTIKPNPKEPLVEAAVIPETELGFAKVAEITPQDLANAIGRFVNITHYSHKQIADLLGANLADIQNWLQGKWYRAWSQDEARACLDVLRAKPILLARQHRVMQVRASGGAGQQQFQSGRVWSGESPNLSAADVVGAIGGKLGMGS